MRLLSLMLLAATTAFAADPQGPPLTFLYSVNLTMPVDMLSIGPGPFGSRQAMAIVGGSFQGPKMAGKVTVGLDWGLTDAKGTFSPDAVYFLQTDDGGNIMVTEKGRVPFVHILFETGSEKYAWLNNVVGLATGAPNEGGVGLNVFQVGA